MYDDIIKRLRELQFITEHCGDQPCSECEAKALCDKNDNEALIETYADAADAIEDLSRKYIEERNAAVELTGELASKPRWIPVTERLPECDLGAEVGNIEWISNGMVQAGCFGRGGKYRDAYFRTWTDAGEGMDAKDADCWRTVTIPQPPKEELA